jgi:hypothetical protein
MTDEEVISEFSRLVRTSLEASGKIEFTSNDLQETEVKFDAFRLSKGYFVNGEVRFTVFSNRHAYRVFFESSGGPGIYGVGDAENRYDTQALRVLLPELRRVTVLDQLADV